MPARHTTSGLPPGSDAYLNVVAACAHNDPRDPPVKVDVVIYILATIVIAPRAAADSGFTS